MDTARIVAEILKGYVMSPWGFHGVTHWARVLENGLKLAEQTGADRDVVTLFALFHDSRRIDDGDDYGHGGRGAELATELRGKVFDLPDAEFELLYRACERHTGGQTDDSITVLTCWDADRLDLGRVGIMPDPRYLCTKAGRSSAMIDWSHTRAVEGYRSGVVDTWDIPSRGEVLESTPHQPSPSDIEIRIGSASEGRTFVQVTHKPTGTKRHQFGMNGESTDAVARKLYQEILADLAGNHPKDS